MERLDRKEETKIVKKALVNAKFENSPFLTKLHNVRVKHGNGTAWGWLKIYADIEHKPNCTCFIRPDEIRDTCQECKDLWRNVYDACEATAEKVTGRHGEYSNINVHLGFMDKVAR